MFPLCTDVLIVDMPCNIRSESMLVCIMFDLLFCHLCLSVKNLKLVMNLIFLPKKHENHGISIIMQRV